MTFIAQTETKSTTKFAPFSTQEKVKKRGRKSENKSKTIFLHAKIWNQIFLKSKNKTRGKTNKQIDSRRSHEKC
jgi:hypothetical protein